MSGAYENFGVEFLYPENWEIVDERLDEWPYRVSVQSPGSGYWELQVYPPDIEPSRLCEQVLQAMRQEYPDLESDSVTEYVYDVPAVGYDLTFFSLDLLVVSRLRALEVAGRTYLLICQAESREFERQGPVFDAITKSLLSE